MLQLYSFLNGFDTKRSAKYSGLIGIVVCYMLLLMTKNAMAQNIVVADADSVPVVGLDIALLGKKMMVRLRTDETGKAQLPIDGYPYKVRLLTNYFEQPNKTINEPRELLLYVRRMEQTIGEVVISGQYVEQDADKAVQRIEVIGRKQIDAMAAQNLRDVLTNQMEIRMDYDAIFGTSMSMQGSGRYGADPKILIDGVPVVGKQNGSVDLSQINLNNIERIEIIKGPMSVSYGTDAIAGTVNLITKKTVVGKKDISISTYGEHIGTYNVNMVGGINKGKHSLRVDGMRNLFVGWKPGLQHVLFDFSDQLADTNRAMLWKPRMQYQAGLQYTYRHRNWKFNYKAAYFYELITNRGTPMAPYNELAIDNFFHTWRIDNALFASAELKQHINFTAFVAYNAYKRIKKEAGNNLTNLELTYDPAVQDTSMYNEINSRGAITSAHPNRKINYEIGCDVTLQYANSTQIDGRIREMGNYAAYSSMEYKPVNGLTIRPGVRYGYNTNYKAPLVPSINMMYSVANHWTFRGSYARGFRQPNLKDLYFDFVDVNHNVHGNPNLKAEYSNNFLASLNYISWINNSIYKASLAAYYNSVNDLITLVTKQGGAPNEYWHQNVSKYYTKGLQANSEFGYKALKCLVGVAWLGTYNSVSDSMNVPRFSYSPELRGNLMYSFANSGLSVNLFYKYTGKSVSFTASDAGAEPEQRFLNAYQMADVTVSKQFWDKTVVLTFGCKNLFDVTNVANTQLSGGAHSGGSQMAAIGTGRYFIAKVEFNFHD